MYQITRAQLSILWVIGLLFWIGDLFYVLDSYDTSGLSLSLLILIPGGLLFYTLGWQKQHKASLLGESFKLKPVSAKYDIEADFFSVSTGKLVVMSVLTFGLYELYWFYKNWEAIKKESKSNISPFWRAWFSIFFCYAMFNQILLSAQKRGIQKVFSAKTQATVYIVLLIVGSISGKIEDTFASLILLIISYFTVLPLIKAQEVINENNKIKDPTWEPRDTFSFLEIVVAFVGLLLLVLVIIASLPE